MSKFVICSVEGDLAWDVHIAGCQDIKRGMTLGRGLRNIDQRGKKIVRIYQESHEVEAKTVQVAIQKEIDSLNSDFGEGTWDENYFTIMPCARKVKK